MLKFLLFFYKHDNMLLPSLYIHVYRFVDEVHHEWGEKVTRSGEIHPLEAAPRRWRLALTNQNKGAFEGWKVNIH